MIRRQAWAIAWRASKGKPSKRVHAAGGLMIYTIKREAELDCDPDSQKIVRVFIKEKKA